MRYVELHCKSNFSFLEGASHADELFERAVELGYSGLAITDRDSLAGIVRGHAAAKEFQLPMIVGAELHPIDGPPLVVWPSDRAAYGRLCRLLSRGRLRREKGACELRWQDIAELNEGLLAGLLLRQPVIDELPPADMQHFADDEAFPWERETEQLGSAEQISTPGPRRSILSLIETQETTAPNRATKFPAPEFDAREDSGWLSWLNVFQEMFGERGYLLAELHRGVDDRAKLTRLSHLSKQSKVPLVASGDVYYHSSERALLHDCLLATRFNSTIDQVRSQRLSNSQHHLRSLETIQRLYSAEPAAIERTQEIAARCKFGLEELRYDYPVELAPDGQTPIEFLKRETWTGAKKRYPGGVPQKVIDMLRHEMTLIEELKYEAYF